MTTDAALLARVGAADYRQWQRQVERARFCSRPVRIAGSAVALDNRTAEVRASFATRDQPDGALLVACGDRRAAVCASCAEVYRRDMWHVVASGLAGRLGPLSSTGDHEGGARQDTVSGVVPGSVGSHPRLFVTLTAPSFGAVHGARGGVCRPRSGARVCAHGRALGCGLVHAPDDRAVGTPLCDQCYDYAGQVLWNAHAGELWRRTRIGIDRALAPAASRVLGRRVTIREVRGLLRVSYVKVAEFQKRGVVHLHVVVRLDGVHPDDPKAIVPPPVWASAGLLAGAVSSAAGSAVVALPSPDGRLRVAAWGAQRDVADVLAGGPGGDARRVAAYLAKYATKTASDSIGSSHALARRFHRLHRNLLRTQAGPHLARLVETAWALGGRRELAHLNLRKWAHTLGFRGHFATKSRAYSLTLGALRAARRTWRARQRVASGEADVWALGARLGADGADAASTVIVSEWRYVGRGYAGAADADLVAMLARERATAVEEYRDLMRREKEIGFWRTDL